MDGWLIFFICAGIGALFAVVGLWSYAKANRLDAELTAYVAEGSLTAELAKSILETKATTARKREVAALMAQGLDASEGLALLEAMPAS